MSIIIQHYSFCVLTQLRTNKITQKCTSSDSYAFPIMPWQDQVPSKALTSAAPAHLQRAATLVSLSSMSAGATNRAQTAQNERCGSSSGSPVLGRDVAVELFKCTFLNMCSSSMIDLYLFLFICIIFTFVFVFLRRWPRVLYYSRLSCNLSCDCQRLWLPAPTPPALQTNMVELFKQCDTIHFQSVKRKTAAFGAEPDGILSWVTTSQWIPSVSRELTVTSFSPAEPG